MTKAEIKAYCESGGNCLSCMFSDCIYDGAAFRDSAEQRQRDADAVADRLTVQQKKFCTLKRMP